MLPPSILLLTAALLDRSADVFSNHGCNDFEMKGYDREDRSVIADLLNRQNLGEDYWSVYDRDDEDVVAASDIKDYAEDYRLMRALAYGLRQMAERMATDATAPAVMP